MAAQSCGVPRREAWILAAPGAALPWIGPRR
jgi:hypothetical protein